MAKNTLTATPAPGNSERRIDPILRDEIALIIAEELAALPDETPAPSSTSLDYDKVALLLNQAKAVMLLIATAAGSGVESSAQITTAAYLADDLVDEAHAMLRKFDGGNEARVS